MSAALPAPFSTWFAARGWTPRAHQLAMVEQAQKGGDVLLIAPTGGGKTLAGFLPSLIELSSRYAEGPSFGRDVGERPLPPSEGGRDGDGGGALPLPIEPPTEKGQRPRAGSWAPPPSQTLPPSKGEGLQRGGRRLHTLYISPLKALTVDVQRNLVGPAAEMGLPIRIESRTGDSSVSKKARQRREPPDILLTTPEQLALFCAWDGARAYFEDLSCVIVDEIHALHSSKRGDLLSLGLSRLSRFAPNLRRIGLSATVDDPERLAAWLSGGRNYGDTILNSPRGPDQRSEDSRRVKYSVPVVPTTIIRGAPGAPPIIDVLLSNNRVPWAGHTAQHAMDEVYAAIAAARMALVFVNTRWQAEFAFAELWRLNEANLPIALHHGSLAAEQRRRVEAAMARGDLRAVVCTSTLDLGIDWGDVDLVIQLAAPKGSSRLVQRIGRANHRMDEPSRALLVPASRFEMLECRAAADAVAENDLDGEPFRTGALDVLAQHVMGCACSEPFDLEALYNEVRTAAPYRDLTWEDYERVVDFVSTGGYALRTYDRFRRIVKGPDGRWKVRDLRTAARHRMNVGAIVGAAVLNVRLAGRGGAGRKIGEAEEWYFEQLVPGDTFLFAGQVWRFEGIKGLDALVTRSPDTEPRVISWGGSKFPLSTWLARRVRRLMNSEQDWEHLPADVVEWLSVQKRVSGLPREDELLIETFAHGRRHFMVCYPFEGRLAHTTLAMLLTRRLDRAGVGPIGYLANDYALAIWAVRPMDRLDFDALFEEDILGDDLEAWLEESSLMKRAFRNCALVSGLIERRFPGEEKTGRQVTFSADLIYDVLRRHQPDHLLLACARADAATGLLDIRRIGDFLARVKRNIRLNRLDQVSPFAVPILMEIGKERAPGASAADLLLEEAENASLIAQAMGKTG